MNSIDLGFKLTQKSISNASTAPGNTSNTFFKTSHSIQQKRNQNSATKVINQQQFQPLIEAKLENVSKQSIVVKPSSLRCINNASMYSDNNEQMFSYQMQQIQNYLRKQQQILSLYCQDIHSYKKNIKNSIDCFGRQLILKLRDVQICYLATIDKCYKQYLSMYQETKQAIINLYSNRQFDQDSLKINNSSKIRYSLLPVQVQNKRQNYQNRHKFIFSGVDSVNETASQVVKIYKVQEFYSSRAQQIQEIINHIKLILIKPTQLDETVDNIKSHFESFTFQIHRSIAIMNSSLFTQTL